MSDGITKACDFIFEESDREAKKWFDLQSKNPAQALYLYFKPGYGFEHGSLSVEICRVDELELATVERISPAWSMEQVTKWMTDIAWRLPILAPYDRPKN